MIRTLLFIVLVGVLVAGGVWLADRPGEVTLAWQGWHVETSVAVLALAVAAIAVLCAMAYRFWRSLRAAPGRFLAHRRQARRERGYRALTYGMVAVAAGDAEEARRHARRADVLLGEPPLTMLLSAQSAQLNGDETAARQYFTAMLDRPETAFLGLRGLLIQAQRAQDDGTALLLAKRAYELRPRAAWVLTAYFDLLARHDRWREALPILEEAVRRGAVPAGEARHRRAVVLLGCSLESGAAGDRPGAVAYAKRAHSLDPDFLPATLRHVALMVEGGKRRPAARVLHNAWRRHPHPELARLYAALEPTDDPLKKMRRFERLAGHNPDHAESHIALAEAALEAQLWGAARSHLEAAAGDAPTARVCRLMAELEEKEKADMEAVRQWLLRAATAEPDSAWTCGSCGAAASAWTPRCARCGALGTLEWRPPDRARGLVLHPPSARDPAPVLVDGREADAGPDGEDGATRGGDGAPPRLTPTRGSAN